MMAAKRTAGGRNEMRFTPAVKKQPASNLMLV